MASASSSPPSSGAALAVLGSLDLMIAITSNLSCIDMRNVTAAVSIADEPAAGAAAVQHVRAGRRE
jgi:hypothetical protein